MGTRSERQKAADDPNGADQARARAETAARVAETLKAAHEAYAEDDNLLQRWLDGENVPMPQGIRRRETGAHEDFSPVSRILRPFTPSTRTCKCGAKYVGISRFCPSCSDALITQHDELEAARAAKADGMTMHEARHKWANLPPDVGRGFNMAVRLEVHGLPEAIVTTQHWLDGKGTPWLVLTGGVGIGKSHLAEVAARTLAARGERVRWQPVGELLDRMRADGEENAYAHLAQVAATPWLVLDDIGVSKPSAWVLDRLHALVNSRAVRQARTLITTNETLAGLTERVGDRVADRVFDSYTGLVSVVTMTGPSFRTGH